MDIRAARKRLTKSGLFDPAWYIATYPEVRGGTLTPQQDFLTFGIHLQRDPGPNFSTAAYVAKHPQALEHPDGPFAYFLEGDLRRGLAAYRPTPLQETKPGNPAHAIRIVGDLSLGAIQARLEDFVLTISGWVLDPERPRTVYRLVLRIGDLEFPPIVARQIVGQDSEAPGPLYAALFESRFTVPEYLATAPVELEVLGTGARFAIHPAQGSEPGAVESPQYAMGPEHVVTGKVTTATPLLVAGWAICEPGASVHDVELLLKIDGAPYMVSRCTQYRQDIQALHGGDGYYGFRFSLPQNLWTGRPLSYELVTTAGRCRIEEATGTLTAPAGLWLGAMPGGEPAWVPQADLDIGDQVSVIILNRNGAAILQEMLASAEISGDLARAEWIVVDHQSTDGSADVCAQFRAAGFDVTFLPRNGNFSFSESNNYAAWRARGNILVFANNDLIFMDPVLDLVREDLRDSRIGILGVQLFDNIRSLDLPAAGPVQHDGVHIKASVEGIYLRPFESRGLDMASEGMALRPAITAAFCAMRREDFEAIGGFDERYLYGLEDIDLCFKVGRDLTKGVVIDRRIRIIHKHGFSRNKDKNTASRSKNNNETFNSTWGNWLRRHIRAEVATRPGFWHGKPPVVGFTVTDTDSSGDYFTARELGDALQAIADYTVVYIPREGWKNLSGIDILINMSPRFDITAVRAVNPFLISLNWIRQFFDQWVAGDAFFGFDHVLASSSLSGDFLGEHWGRSVPVMPIASNVAKFGAGTFQKEYQSDYCFTGSSFGVSRDIQFDLDPPAIKGKGLVFGKNWQGTGLEPISVGPIDYSEMPNVYASSRIVIDDAVFATGPWASCNSRIFDALAAGCLVVTNNDKGAEELFLGLLPVYRDRETLTEVLNYWLTHEDKRRERVGVLKDMVVREHSYAQRAEQIHALVQGAPPLRIAIKCPAYYAQRGRWGDTHFANSLADSLRRLGCAVRVDFKENWTTALGATDDVVIVLRGLSEYAPSPGQLNIAWVISHPDAVSTAELARYDHVFVASKPYTDHLAEMLSNGVSFLPQCSDTRRFNFDSARIGRRADRALFVGNSRGVFRPAVRWAVEQDLSIDIYGENWDGFVKDSRLKGRAIPNEVLGELYSSSGLVLSDHWADMARYGFLSNRAYDVLACGGQLLTDPVAGIEDLLPEGSYLTFASAEDLAAHVRAPLDVDPERRKAFSDWVVKNHSFDVRAREILSLIRKKMNGFSL